MFICHLTLTWGWTNDRSTSRVVSNKSKPFPIIVRADNLLSFKLTYSSSSSCCYPCHLYLNGNVLKCTDHKLPEQICFLRICKSASLGTFCILSTTLDPYTPSRVYLSFLFSQLTFLPRSELLMHFDKRSSSRAQGIQTCR